MGVILFELFEVIPPFNDESQERCDEDIGDKWDGND